MPNQCKTVTKIFVSGTDPLLSFFLFPLESLSQRSRWINANPSFSLLN